MTGAAVTSGLGVGKSGRSRCQLPHCGLPGLCFSRNSLKNQVRTVISRQQSDVARRSATGLTVRGISVSAVDSEFVRQWSQLESSSLDGNAFLSPGFVQSLERNLSEPAPFVVAVEDEATGTLAGLGVFEEVRGTRLLPLTHLRAFETDFGFTSGVLLDACHADAAADALFGWLKANGSWNGLAFSRLPTDSQTTRTLIAAAERNGHGWREDSLSQRACIRAEEIPDEAMSLYSKSRRKSLRQNLRKLASNGNMHFQIHTEDASGRCLAEFLRLEACGWKGEGQSALGCAGNLSTFAREWAASLAEAGQLAICELSIDGRPVAMSLNPISGDTMFAFKIGWDSEFASCSPGNLCEWFTLQSLPTELPQIRFVDSCATTGSYIEKIWPWTFELADGVFPTTWLGSLAVDSMLRLKQVKRLLRG